jgi:hypothetical protein
VQLAGPGGGAAQVPRVPLFVHELLQQSLSMLHTSPVWPQNDEFEQMPFLQSDEQQSPLPAHGLPSVLHWFGEGSGTHLPAVHVPLQHCAPVAVHAALSAMQS